MNTFDRSLKDYGRACAELSVRALVAALHVAAMQHDNLLDVARKFEEDLRARHEREREEEKQAELAEGVKVGTLPEGI